MKIRSKVLLALVAAGMVVVLANCGKETAPTTTTGTFGGIYTNTFSKACVECHVPTGPATVSNGAQFDVTTQATAYATLHGATVAGLTTKGICPSVNLVVASSAATSYLVGTLFSDYAKSGFGGVTGCTPYNGHSVSLSTSEKDAIISWIQAGALNN